MEIQFEEGGLGRCIYWKLRQLRGELALGRQLGQAFRNIRSGLHVPITDRISHSSLSIIHSKAF